MSTLAAQVHEALQQQILAGTPAVGEALPTEQQLCQQFAVSRITVRHALRLLREQGLIDSRPGRGTFVRSARPQKLRILDGQFALSIRTQAPRLRRRVLSRELAVPPPRVAEALGLLAGQRCLAAQRLDVLDEEPLAYDWAYIPEPLAAGIDEAMLQRVDFLSCWLASAGLEMSHGSETVEAVAADRDSAALLGVAAAAPMLLTTGAIFGPRSRPLALFETLYRGDRYKLVSTLAREVP